jgi:hypothetical protein
MPEIRIGYHNVTFKQDIETDISKIIDIKYSVMPGSHYRYISVKFKNTSGLSDVWGIGINREWRDKTVDFLEIDGIKYTGQDLIKYMLKFRNEKLMKEIDSL